MLDRLKNNLIRNGGQLYWLVGGKRVPLLDEAHAVKILQRVDELVGEADEKLITLGPRNRVDDRTASQRVADEAISLLPKRDENLYERMLRVDAETHAQPAGGAREHFRRENLRKAEELREAEPPAPPTKAQLERLAEASEHYLCAVYSGVPMSRLKHCERMLDAAKAGDGARYKELHSEFTAAAESRLAAADEAMAAEQNRIRRERSHLGRSDFEFTTPEPETPTEGI